MLIVSALIPAKPAHRAKARLQPALGRRARALLGRAMLEDVLDRLDESGIFITIAVVTRDRALRRRCRRLGAHTLTPPPRVRGLNPELRWAADRPEIAGSDRLLVLPGDVPGVQVSDLFRLVLPPMDAGIRLVESPDGGTNALLTVPPDCIPFRFGPNSAARHRAAARRAGLPAETLPLPSLLVDIDYPADLPHDSTRIGPRTRRLLARLKRGHIRYARRRRPRRSAILDALSS